ncbi:RNA polymerase sigma factor [Rubrobacter marinus]|uniref:RNA polymerase sigma factor n=1 Tax=Rubrobacter marinus TaxID=2653852 RepID=UPI001A9CF30A
MRAYGGVAFRAAYLILGDSAEAEDASQEAFVKAYRALARFEPGASFGPWILAITSNEARNRRKAAGRRVGLSLRAAEEGVGRGDGSLSPEAALVAQERRAELLEALEGLREEDRAVIGYRYFLDLSEAETAEVLGCARGTVKSRLSRALGRLREALRKEQDAG